MRRTIQGVLWLVAVATIFALSQAELRAQPLGVQETYLIISDDAPEEMKYGGSMRFICDGDADEEQWQAAIDAAEALGLSQPPEVHISTGEYSFDAPVYVGYSGGLPNQNTGVSLIGLGDVRINTNFTDEGRFVIYYQPTAGRLCTIEKLDINLNNALAGGLYASGMNQNSRISSVRVRGGRVACIYLDRCWLSRLDDIAVQSGSAVGIGVSGFNAGRADNIAIGSGMVGSHLTTGGVIRYVIDNLAGTFYTGEEVNINNAAGAERGVILDVSSTALLIGHGTRARFVNNDTIYGVTSTATADVDTTIQDRGAALLINGGQCYWTNLNIEGNRYTDDDAGYDHPLVLGYSNVAGTNARGGITIKNVRFESITGEFAGKQADVWFHFIGVDGVRLEDVGALSSVTDLFDSAVAVVGQGDSTSDIADIDTGLTGLTGALTLDVGDTIYLWDTADDTNDGSYTVSAVGEGTATINDGDFTDASIRLYATTLATRRQPEYFVILENCNGAVISNVRADVFDAALVQVDSDCKNCIIDNVFDYRYSRCLLITEDYWMRRGLHGVILDDSGENTKLINPLIQDPTALEYLGWTGVRAVTENVNGTQYRTTLLLKDVEMTVTDAGAGDDGYGNVKIFDFPEGRIQVLGVVADLTINVSARFDTGAKISDTGSGDFSLGTTGTADTTLDGTDVDLGASAAMDDPFVSGIGATLHGSLGASAQFDGTATAKDCYLNSIFDAGDVTANSTAGFSGTVTIHWVNLGDY